MNNLKFKRAKHNKTFTFPNNSSSTVSTQINKIKKNNGNNKKAENYTTFESDINETFEDDLLYCYECEKKYIGECRIHKSRWILNKKITCSYTSYRTHSVFDEYYNENLDITECFCKGNPIKHIKTTLPYGFFLVKSKTKNTTYGVWSKNCITQGTILGPFLGALTSDHLITEVVENFVKDGVQDFIWSLVPTNNVGDYSLIDARNCMTANYLRFIRRSENEDNQNLNPFQFDGKIFCQAIRDIRSNEELIMNYDVRIIHHPNFHDPITIRIISPNGLCNINEVEKQTKKNRITNENKDEKNLNVLKINVDELVSTTSPIVHSISPNSPQNITDKNSINEDDEIRKFLEEISIKHPLITGTEANILLRSTMPHKPYLTDHAVHLLLTKNNFQPLVSSDEVLDSDSIKALVKMFKQNSELSYRDAKTHLEGLFPLKPPITFESIDRIVRLNKLKKTQTSRRKIDSGMLDIIENVLKGDPWMSVKDLNKYIQNTFPNKPKISNDYLNMMISKYKLRPIKNARKKMNDEMKDYICTLYYQKKLTLEEVCQKLIKKFPNRPLVSEQSVARVIKLSSVPIVSNEKE